MFVYLHYFGGNILGLWHNFAAEKSPASVDQAARGKGLASKLITEAHQIGVQGPGFRVQGAGCRLQGQGSRVS